MSAPAWMPLYVADYLADTGHLSRDEHGAYMLLIMHYWQHGGLPDDDQKLARITQSANVDDWLSIRQAIVQLFQPGWRHKRIDQEIAVAAALIEKRARAGKIGGLSSASKRQANVEQSLSKRSTRARVPLLSSSLRSEEKKEEKKENIGPPNRATRLPAGYAELSRVLDDERTRGVIEHRQKFKKPLTAHAAKLLAQKFEQCPNPNEAADEMVARGWQGFKPEWLVERKLTGKPDPSVYVPKPPPPDDPYANVFVEGFMGLHGKEELAAAKAKYIKITKGSQ